MRPEQLLAALRGSGYPVHEVSGWRTRKRPNGSFTPKGVLVHDTVGAQTGDAPTLNVATNGRSDLPGPLYNVLIGRSGKIYLIAAGRCAHAGSGSLPGVASGNRQLYGVALENAGGDIKQPYPPVQLLSLKAVVASINDALGVPFSNVWGHKEYAPGRKIDPWGIDMDGFRKGANVSGQVVLPGNRDETIRRIQKALGVKEDGDPYKETAATAEKLRADYNKLVDEATHLEGRVVDEAARADDLAAELLSAQTELASAETELVGLQNTVKALEAQIDGGTSVGVDLGAVTLAEIAAYLRGGS